MPLVSPLQTGTGDHAQKQQMQLLVFSLNGEEFACPLTDVREIMNTPNMTVVPNISQAVKGIVNVRGRVMTVVDLGTVFQFQKNDNLKQHVIVLEKDKEQYGLLVDSVQEVLRTSQEYVKPTPPVLQLAVSANFVRGVLVIDAQQKKDAATANSRMILVLNMQNILDTFTRNEA